MPRSCKTSAVICVLLLVLCCVAPTAQAASPGTILNPADYISSTGYVGNYRVVDFDFGRTPYLEWLASNHVSGYGEIQFTPPSDSALKGSFKIYPLGSSKMLGPPLDSNNVVIDITDFKSNAALSIVSEVRFEVDYALAGTDVQSEEPFSVSCVWSFLGYRSTGTFVGTVNSLSKTYQYTLQDTPDPFVAEFPFSLTLGLDFPSDVTYVIPYLSVNINTLYDDPDIVINKVACSCNDFNLSARTDMLLKESMTLDAIDDKLDDTNDKLDQIIQQPENEKQEATNEGSEMIDQLTGALPNESQGFMDAIQELADAMSYEGTEAKLTFPAISLPEIPGVMKSYKLNDELPIDFGFWVQKIPAPILTLVQVVLTIALVVFAFKELYGMISYAMTLKGGGN